MLKKEVVRPPIRLVALDKFGLSSKMEHPPYGTFNMASGNHLYMTLRKLFAHLLVGNFDRILKKLLETYMFSVL